MGWTSGSLLLAMQIHCKWKVASQKMNSPHNDASYETSFLWYFMDVDVKPLLWLKITAVTQPNLHCMKNLTTLNTCSLFELLHSCSLMKEKTLNTLFFCEKEEDHIQGFSLTFAIFAFHWNFGSESQEQGCSPQMHYKMFNACNEERQEKHSGLRAASTLVMVFCWDAEAALWCALRSEKDSAVQPKLRNQIQPLIRPARPNLEGGGLKGKKNPWYKQPRDILENLAAMATLELN